MTVESIKKNEADKRSHSARTLSVISSKVWSLPILLIGLLWFQEASAQGYVGYFDGGEEEKATQEPKETTQKLENLRFEDSLARLKTLGADLEARQINPIESEALWRVGKCRFEVLSSTDSATYRVKSLVRETLKAPDARGSRLVEREKKYSQSFEFKNPREAIYHFVASIELGYCDGVRFWGGRRSIKESDELLRELEATVIGLENFFE